MPLRQSLLLRRDEVPIAPDLHRRHGNGPGQGLGCYPAEEHGSKPGPRVPGPATTQGSMDPTQPTRYPGPPQPLQQAMDSTRLPQKTPCAYWHMDPTSAGVHAPAPVRPASSPLRSRGLRERFGPCGEAAAGLESCGVRTDRCPTRVATRRPIIACSIVAVA
jgi:hypothetical protein